MWDLFSRPAKTHYTAVTVLHPFLRAPGSRRGYDFLFFLLLQFVLLRWAEERRNSLNGDMAAGFMSFNKGNG